MVSQHLAQIAPFIARSHFWPRYPHGLRGQTTQPEWTCRSLPLPGLLQPGRGCWPWWQSWLLQDKLITSTYLPTVLNKADLEQAQRRKVLQMVLPLTTRPRCSPDLCRLSPESSPTGSGKSQSDGVNRWLRIRCTLTHILHVPVSGPETSRRGIWPHHIEQSHGHPALKPLLAPMS